MEPVQEHDPDELIDAAKNWLAMDGLWFQAVEQVYGMDAALAIDREVWEQYAVIEARRIQERFSLPENGGLEALEIAFNHRLASYLNILEIRRPDKKTLIVTTKTCRVQSARERKDMPLFPCKSVGLVEFPVFARTIDARIKTSCLSCPPDTLPGTPYCSWKFTLDSEEKPVMNAESHWTLGKLFTGRPGAFRLFGNIRKFIETLGPVTVEATKTRVSFGTQKKFAWVWLPQMFTKKRPGNSITLTFAAGRQIIHHRIAESVEPRPGRWTHPVVIEKEPDLDDDVKDWLREAFAFRK